MAGKFLANAKTGHIFNPNPVEKLTKRELQHIADGDWVLMDKPADKVSEIDKKHCELRDGKVEIMEYTKWPDYEALIEVK